jgi:hypothetical protein
MPRRRARQPPDRRRSCHNKPDSNKGCAAGKCQHTCEAWQAPNCPHKWTVRYSVNSRQREQSFGTLTEAQTFQLTLSTGKQTQGAMFTDPRAGIVEFLPLCDAYIEGMAKANAKSKATYGSNFADPAVAKLLQGRSVLDVAKMDAEVKTLLNKTLGSYSDDYRGNVRRPVRLRRTRAENQARKGEVHTADRSRRRRRRNGTSHHQLAANSSQRTPITSVHHFPLTAPPTTPATPISV